MDAGDLVELSTLSSARDVSIISRCESKDETQDADGYSDTVSLVPAQARRPFRGHRLWPRGWRGGVRGFFFGVCFVFVVNVSFAVWAGSREASLGGQGIIFDGSCSTVHTLDTLIHLIINALGTIILGGSNYCMQILCAPTRGDIDRGHSRGQALQVGIASVTNLLRIRWRPVILWSVLGLSSIPLLFLYNSVVYSSTSANDYVVLMVNDAFTRNVPLNNNFSSVIVSVTSEAAIWTDPNNTLASYTSLVHDLRQQAINNSLDRLDARDCIAAYGHTFLSTRSNLLLVASSTDNDSDTETNGTVYGFLRVNNYDMDSGYDPIQWICEGNHSLDSGQKLNSCQDNLNDVIKHDSNWMPLNCHQTVDYCYSQKAQAHCRLQYSKGLIIAVICMNICKIAVMAYMTFKTSQALPLLVLGDAIASFIATPDKTTKGACLSDIAEFKNFRRRMQPVARQFHAKRYRWARANSYTRWTIFTLLYCVALATVIGLLTWGTAQIHNTRDIKTLWGLGIGQANSETLISHGYDWSLLFNVLISNSPQIILSIIYVNYNSLLTSMLSAREWSRLARDRKGLRVSEHPRGDQRSSFWLQLPYRFALPIIGLSSLLHWLVSQSIFLVSVIRYDPYGTIEQVEENSSFRTGYPLVTCGWSPAAIILTILVSTIMIISAVVAACQTYEPGMPFAGASSAVISAACHVVDDSDLRALVEKRLRWGVVRGDDENEDGHIGHCAFSDSEDVQMPIEGQLYA